MTVYEINVYRSDPESVGTGYAAPRVPLLDMKTEDAGMAAMNLRALSLRLEKLAAGPAADTAAGDTIRRFESEVVDGGEITWSMDDVVNLLDRIACEIEGRS